MPPSLTFDSPKRKRTPPPSITPRQQQQQPPNIQLHIPPTSPTTSPNDVEDKDIDMRYPTNINGVQVVIQEQDPGSPRTKVAYQFQGLQLENGGEVSKLALDAQRSQAPKLQAKSGNMFGSDGTDESAVRKRMRVLERQPGNGMGRELEIPETPEVGAKQFGIRFGPERTIDPFIEQTGRRVILQNEVDPVVFRGNPAVARTKGSGLARAYPSINRLADSKSRAKPKRAGTPPLFGSADEMATLVDPERAALTWHDDEITGHNPDDPDDDGEGINGIGFRPTAAEAYARTQKRKQQMAEYKSREMKEARAKRSEKRRGIELAMASEEKEAQRRVRFMEAGKTKVVTIP